MKKLRHLLTYSMCFLLVSCGTTSNEQNESNSEFIEQYTVNVYQPDGTTSTPQTLYATYDGDQYIYFGNNSYTFYGYYTKANGEGEKIVDENGKVLPDFTSKVSEATFSIYPYIVEREYTLSFVTGTTDVVVPQQHKATDSYSLPEVSKTGYCFQGWSAKSDDFSGTNNVYSGQFYQDTTLYAIFRPTSSRVAYSNGEYESGIMDVDYDSVATIPWYEKQGYNFAGYYFDVERSQQATDKNGQLLSPWNKTDRGVTLYPKYDTAPMYKLTYANDGYVSNVKVTYKDCFADVKGNRSDRVETFGDGVTIKHYYPDPKKGYYFNGWLLQIDDNEYKKFDFSTSEVFTEDIVLVPDWKEIPYSVYTDLVLSEAVGDDKNLKIISTHAADINGELVRYYSDFTGHVSIHFSVQSTSTGGAIIDILDEIGVLIPKNGEYTKEVDITKGECIGIKVKNEHASQTVTVYYTITADLSVVSQKTASIPTSFFVDVTHGNHFDVPVYKKTGKVFKGYYSMKNSGAQITDENGHSLDVWKWDSDKELFALYIDD